MSIRAEKLNICEEVRRNLAGADFAIFTDYTGMTVTQLTDLRGRLRPLGSRVQVVSNSFLSRVAKERGIALAESHLNGPTAMIWGTGDVTVIAKQLQTFVRECKLPLVKGGILGDRAIGSQDVSALAAMPARETLLAMVVGTVAAPMSRLVGVMQAKLSSLVYVLKAVADKKESKP